MTQCSNKNRRNVLKRLVTFVNQPFFEQKYIILVKLIRLFCDWAYISKRTLKVITKNSFLKIGYSSSPLTIIEIRNLEKIGLTGFVEYLLPFKIIKFGPLSIIRYPRANIDAPITDTELFDMVRDLSKFSVKVKIEVMEQAYIKEFIANNYSAKEDERFLRKIELYTLCGPIHGDFDSSNIVRYNNKLRLIDFDNFEPSGIHFFDFISAFCFLGYIQSPLASWFDYFKQMVDRWDDLESHEYWNELTPTEKRAICYLFVIWRWYKEILIPKSDTSDQMIKDILKNIRELPV